MKTKEKSNIRFLACKTDGQIHAYHIEEDGTAQCGQQIDLCWLFKHRDDIQTGFYTREEAQAWLKAQKKNLTKKKFWL